VFGWLSRSDLPEDATVDWLFDVFGWLFEETGGYQAFRARATRVLPTDEFFPVSANLEGHDLALALFTAAREHAGLADRACKLIRHEESPTTRDGLAIFLALLGPELRAVASKLNDNPHGYVKTALKHLAKEKSEELARLRSIGAGASIE